MAMYLSTMTSTSSNNNKRLHSSLIVVSPSSQPPCKRIKRTITVKQPKKKKSVGFSQSVSLRCFYVPEGSNATSSWMKKEDVDKLKNRAKSLSKVHCHIRSKAAQQASTTATVATIAQVARYQIKGESLRGMEYITDGIVGRKRRRNQAEAMTAAVIEQQSQLIEAVLASSSVDQAVGEALKMDSGRMARAYGSKTQEALKYARDVACADAEIAAEILAEDLNLSKSSQSQHQSQQHQPSFQLRRSSKGKKSASNTLSADPNRLTAEIIRTLLPRTLSRHRNLVSVQA